MERRIRINRAPPDDASLYDKGFTDGYTKGCKDGIDFGSESLRKLREEKDKLEKALEHSKAVQNNMTRQLDRYRRNQGKGGTNADKALKRRRKELPTNRHLDGVESRWGRDEDIKWD